MTHRFAGGALPSARSSLGRWLVAGGRDGPDWTTTSVMDFRIGLDRPPVDAGGYSFP